MKNGKPDKLFPVGSWEGKRVDGKCRLWQCHHMEVWWTVEMMTMLSSYSQGVAVVEGVCDLAL